MIALGVIFGAAALGGALGALYWRRQEARYFEAQLTAFVSAALPQSRREALEAAGRVTYPWLDSGTTRDALRKELARRYADIMGSRDD